MRSARCNAHEHPYAHHAHGGRARTARAAKLHEHDRAGNEREGEGDELGVRVGEHPDVGGRTDGFFAGAEEDEVGDVYAAGVELRLDELGEDDEEECGGDEGGYVDDLEAVGHFVVPLRVRAHSDARSR